MCNLPTKPCKDVRKTQLHASSNGVRQVHTITPNEREHLSVLSCINAAGEYIPNFYTFKGKQFRHNYIKHCETKPCMAMQPKVWMKFFLFSNWVSSFISSVQSKWGNMSQSNQHLLIMDCHNSLVTVEVVLQARQGGLDLVTLHMPYNHWI